MDRDLATPFGTGLVEDAVGAMRLSPLLDDPVAVLATDLLVAVRPLVAHGQMSLAGRSLFTVARFNAKDGYQKSGTMRPACTNEDGCVSGGYC